MFGHWKINLKAQKVWGEFEADIMLRAMTYSAGEDWVAMGGGLKNGGTEVLRATGGASDGAEAETRRLR